MASFNQWIGIGNLTRDVQIKQLGSGTSVAEFGIACNRKFKDAGGNERDDVLFIDCSCFGKRGEVINQYFSKGKPIMVIGRLHLDQWDDKQTGAKRSKIGVIVDDFQFVGGRDDGGGDQAPQRQQQAAPPQRQQASRPTGNRPTARPSQRPRRPAEAPHGGEGEFTEADIPFKWEGRNQRAI